MSTIERIEISCDVRGCASAVVTTPDFTGHGEQGWYITTATASGSDLCPAHAPEPVAPPAPAAAPTAGTSSTEPIAFALSADDAVWVADALERYVTATGRARGVLRRLNAEIEDYARSLA